MKNSILIIAVLVVLFSAGVIFMNSQKESPQELETQRDDTPLVEENIQEPAEATQLTRKDAMSVVGDFIDNFIAAAPPESNEEALSKAVSLLSEGARTDMQEEPTSGDLAMLMGVQDIPDEGYVVGEVEYLENPATGIVDGIAEVEVTLNYSGGPASRVFVLSKVDNYWQIDTIKVL